MGEHGIDNHAYENHGETSGTSMNDMSNSTIVSIPDSKVRSGCVIDEETRSTLGRIKRHFSEFANEDGTIPKASFMCAIGDKRKSFLAERFFDSLDTDSSGTLDMEELTSGVQRLMCGSLQDRVTFIFNLYDKSGDGKIEFEELKQVLMSSTEESNMHISEKNVESLTETFIEEVDKDHDGQIELRELYEYLAANPSLIIKITTESTSWLIPPDTAKRKFEKKKKVPLDVYLKNNAKRIIFVVVILLINVCLFFVNCYNYMDHNWWIIIARGAGLGLDFDCSIVLLLPLKKFITRLRMSPLRTYLPLDHNIALHKLIVYLIILWATIHTLAHIGNAVTVAESDHNVTVPEFIFTTKADIGWVGGLAPVTGVILVVILAVIFVLSLPWIRRNGYFQVFFWSHKLYSVFYIMCILHATHFWKWFLLPGTIALVDLVYTFCFYRTSIVEQACLLPSGVTQVVIKTPPKFKFSPGDYVYLCLPAIAKYEWHPFTISSAPEMKGTFWVHIRTAGSWTNRLRNYFSKKGEVPYTESFKWTSTRETSGENGEQVNGDLSRSFDSGMRIRNSMRKRAIIKKSQDQILITGPFGTPCREIFETEHPILVGGGIGVTPFASILQSIFFHLKKSTIDCPNCAHRWSRDEVACKKKFKKVDFVWINRGSQSFEWFAELLSQLEQKYRELDLYDIFTMHLYMTGAHTVQELMGLGIQVALEVKYQKTRTDFLTGLGTKTKAGRPKFDQLFSDINQRSSYKKKVFMCGSPALAKDVKGHCETHGIGFSQEHF